MILFKNATIIDGSGNGAYIGSILVEGDRIVDIGKTVSYPKGTTIIDANDKYITPAFIDLNLLDVSEKEGDISENLKYFKKQGVGSFILETDSDNNFINSDENIYCSLSYNLLRKKIFPFDEKLSRSQALKLESLIAENLDKNFIALSINLREFSENVLDLEEILGIAKIVKEKGKVLNISSRAVSSGDLNVKKTIFSNPLIKAYKEIVEISKLSGVKLNIRDILLIGNLSQKLFSKIMEMIDQANRSACDISFQVSPYNFLQVKAESFLPQRFKSLYKSQVLSDTDIKKLKALYKDLMKKSGLSYKDISLVACGQNYTDLGKSLAEIAEKESRDPFEVFEYLLKSSAILSVNKAQSDDMLDEMIRNPYAIFSSRAVYREDGMVDEGVFTNYPKFFRLAVEKGIYLEDLVYKFTGKVAERYGLRDRGILKKGYYADLALLKKDKIASSAPSLIDSLYVNGNRVK